MELRDYFENTSGHGVLSTADADGNVDAALYGRPHVMDDGSVAFIMNDRLSHSNLRTNPHAVYLFIEETPSDGKRWSGKRLYLTKTGENTDSDLIHSLRRHTREDDSGKTKYLVTFSVDRIRPLTGD